MKAQVVIMLFVAAAILGSAVEAQVDSQHQGAHVAPGESQPSDASREPTESPTEVGPHGGTLQKVGGIQLETVIQPGGLEVFAYTADGKPMELGKARGLATLQVAGGAKRYRYDLFPDVGPDKRARSLAIAVDLSRIAGRQATVAYRIAGIGPDKRKLLRVTTAGVVPTTQAQLAAAAIESQKVCPVSGQPLGAMGKPIAVSLGEQTVYVCCAGCVDAVKSEPTKFASQRGVKLTVAKATEADRDAVARQGVCPVMDEPLGSMGAPLKVTGLGREVFLCCKGCLKFLRKQPQQYLAKLPPMPQSTKPQVMKATEQDAQHVAAQQLCPVMDEPLDSMGGPFKTIVSGRIIYLCCPGCAKKLHANSDAYLAKLSEQGVTPPERP